MLNDLLTQTPTKHAESPSHSTVDVKKRTTASHGRRRVFRFGLEVAGAQRVSVVGTFNNWDPEAAPMRCVGGTRWFVYCPVETGRHEYRFMVDGRMVDDPKGEEFVPAAQGGRNAVLRVVQEVSPHAASGPGASPEQPN
jgi:1,4-alpha-glucan branching enzyme